MGLFDFFNKPKALPSLQGYDPNAGFNGVVNQSQYIPGINNLVNSSNQSFQESINNLLPGYRSGLATSTRNTNSLLNGELPSDVQDQLYRSSAYKAFAGGYGANSGMGHNLTLRDLGLNSLQAMQLGQNFMGQNLNYANMLTPSRVSQFLQGPQYFQNVANSNVDIANQNKMIGYANATRQSPFEQFLSNIPGMALNAGLQAGIGAATGGAGNFLGLLGGGGSFNSNPSNDAFNSLYSNGSPYSRYSQPDWLSNYPSLSY